MMTDAPKIRAKPVWDHGTPGIWIENTPENIEAIIEEWREIAMWDIHDPDSMPSWDATAKRMLRVLGLKGRDPDHE